MELREERRRGEKEKNKEEKEREKENKRRGDERRTWRMKVSLRKSRLVSAFFLRYFDT